MEGTTKSCHEFAKVSSSDESDRESQISFVDDHSDSEDGAENDSEHDQEEVVVHKRNPNLASNLAADETVEPANPYKNDKDFYNREGELGEISTSNEQRFNAEFKEISSNARKVQYIHKL